MFGKKKSFPGIVALYYEGLSGFDQNCVLYINHDDQGVKFIKPNSDLVVTLPYEKLLTVEYMPEPDYMLRYHNNQTATSKSKVEKWYVVIQYKTENETKTIGLWTVPGKELTALRAELTQALQHSAPQSYTL